MSFPQNQKNIDLNNPTDFPENDIYEEAINQVLRNAAIGGDPALINREVTISVLDCFIESIIEAAQEEYDIERYRYIQELRHKREERELQENLDNE